MVPSRRKSRPSGTSSAVSSRPSIVRAIAPVRALTTREAVDWDTPGRRWESGRRVVVDWLPRFALPSREGPRIEAGEAILARVSGGPRRAAGREPAGIATTSRDEPGPACVMRAQRNGIHPTSRHASSVRRNPPQLDPRHPTSHNASPADTTKTDAPGDGAHRPFPRRSGVGAGDAPGAGLTDGRRTGSRAAPRLPRGRRADERRDRRDRTRSRPSPATETSPFSRRRGRQAVFRRIPPDLGPLLPWVPSVDGSNREKIPMSRAPRPARGNRPQPPASPFQARGVR